MALKPGTKEYEQWRKKNFNLNVKVPQSAIDKLMKGGTPSANIKKYAGTNDKVMREAMNRFYGKGWEKKAPGFKGGSNGGNQGPTSPRVAENTKPQYGTNTRSARAAEGSKGYKAPSKVAKAKSAQKKLNDSMRSSDYRPTTSIGSFNPNAQVSKKDFSYKKLTPNQKILLDAGLTFMLMPGWGGLVAKGASAIKSGVSATKVASMMKKAKTAQGATKPLALGVGPKGKAIQMQRFTAAQEAKAVANATKATVNAAEKQFKATIAKNTENFKKGLITRSEFVKLNDQARAAKLTKLISGARKTAPKKGK